MSSKQDEKDWSCSYRYCENYRDIKSSDESSDNENVIKKTTVDEKGKRWCLVCGHNVVGKYQKSGGIHR